MNGKMCILMNVRFALPITIEETLFIDDFEPNVKAAQAIGINTIHFTDRHKGYEEIRERLKEKKQRATINF